MKNEKTGKSRLLLRFLKGSKRYFLLCILFTLLLSLFDLINPRIVSYTVDFVLGSETPEKSWELAVTELLGSPAFLKERLWIPALLILLFSLLSLVSRYFFNLTNSIGGEKMVLNMRRTLFSHIEHLPYSWHSGIKTGDIIQRCTSDVDTVRNFLAEQLTSLLRISVLIVLSVVFMFGIYPPLAWVAVCSIPIIVVYSAVFHKYIGKHFKECDEAEGLLSAIAQENLTGVRVVRAFGREKYEKERFRAQSGVYADNWIRLDKLFSLYWGLGDLISGVQVLLIVVFGTVFCVRGEMTAGEFIAFVSYNSMLIWPVRQLGRMISRMSQANVSIGRIAEIMNEPTETDRDVTETADYGGDIVFDDVTFSYTEGSEPVLKNVSFRIPHGTTFGILGTTGSGKSTLTLLLDRLCTLKEGCGRITVGGTDLASLPAAELRSHIGMVMQEPFLFSRTLRENIRIARPDAGQEEIDEAADVACLTQTISDFTNGYETKVGERGVTLSGGQKQRTAIARMLTLKAPIMIFDDALSAVDAETDAKIRRALRQKTSDATVILISHRISTLMHADHIVVLDRGTVTEEGDHAFLSKNGGLYEKIYRIQRADADHAAEGGEDRG